jgi:hypothetical protein
MSSGVRMASVIARSALPDTSIQFHGFMLYSLIYSETMNFAQELPELLGIHKPCPTNIWFLIKTLNKLGFQKTLSKKVRLNLKIRNMLGYPKKISEKINRQAARKPLIVT